MVHSQKVMNLIVVYNPYWDGALTKDDEPHCYV